MPGAGDRWTPEQIEKLQALVASGASATRAAAALNRKVLAVKKKANDLGTPFPTLRETRAKLKAAFESDPNSAR